MQSGSRCDVGRAILGFDDNPPQRDCRRWFQTYFPRWSILGSFVDHFCLGSSRDLFDIQGLLISGVRFACWVIIQIEQGRKQPIQKFRLWGHDEWKVRGEFKSSSSAPPQRCRKFQSSRRPIQFCRSAIAVLWIWSMLFRVGEAHNPGPCDDTNFWEFGIFNPSGLSTKTSHVAHMGGEIWGCSETHLTKHGTAKFKRGLQVLQSPFKYILPGAPAEMKTSTDVGTYTGVMLLSKHPARALMHEVMPELYQTGRLQFSGIFVNGMWVQVGLIYGYPIGANHAHHRFQTDLLLEAAIDRIGYQAQGPRIICGDFNHSPSALSQVSRLRSLGFIEAQEISLFRWGQSEQATGKGVLKLDQIWLSPELQSFLTMVQIDRQAWPDHAAIKCRFQGSGAPLTRDEWYLPLQFPWPNQWSCEVQYDQQSSPTIAYAKLWHELEIQANISLQHKGISPVARHFGRGRTIQTTRKNLDAAPCKIGREGDEHPKYFGQSIQHNRWFKQLRRLQALHRLSDQHPTQIQHVHRAEIWRAIRYAPGFAGGFSAWWAKKFPTGQFANGLPVIVPTQDIVTSIYQSFRSEVRAFEYQLGKTLVHDAKQRRKNDVGLIFKDCPKEQPHMVDSLVDSRVGTIVDIIEDDSSIVLSCPIQLIPQVPVVAKGHSLQIIYHESDQLWLQDIANLEIGDQIRQESVISSDRDILHEFETVWGKRWQKIAHLESSQWNQVTDFLRRVVAPIQWDFSEWSCDNFNKVIRSKKKRSATGPDGVSRADLLRLPTNGCQAFVQMYQLIEQTGVWPKQLTVGIVKSLDKNKGAHSVDGFRPITIYPMLYRAWSSFRAKEALLSLAKKVPKSVRGGLPARQSRSIWYEISQLIESSHHEGSDLSGIVLDIRRAFNAIPRVPIWEMLHLLQFPESLLRAWASFVSGQVRRFRVRRSAGCEIQSCVGMPEGCAMSVFGMALIDWALDMWISEMYKLPSQLFSYVDDWQIAFENHHEYPFLLQLVQEFSSMLDLEIDFTKSYVWSTRSEARTALKTGPIEVVQAARDLGAHQNFTRHPGNKVLQQRFDQVAEIWPSLRKSLCPYRSKVLGIAQIGWPKALYGISIVHAGPQHFIKLRTGALRALRSNRIGTHPAVHLLTISPFTDPECWAIRQTLQDARLLGSIDQCRNFWIQMSYAPENVPGNGPASVLARRLSRLGWIMTSKGTWIDDIGEFCPLSAHWPAVQLRIRLSWPKVVATMVAHRSSFAGIQQADWFLTSSALSQYGEADRVFIKCALDGTMYTDTYKEKSQRGANSPCVYCGEVDGFYHRLWVCKHFQDARKDYPWMHLLEMLPKSLTCHGWAMQPPSWCKLLSSFEQIDAPSFRHLPAIRPQQTIDLFTDGTCQCPHEFRLRFAGWAVTIASPFVASLEHVVVGAGQVTGLHQSSYRAEVIAIQVALKFVQAHRCKARLWCDCQSVVNKLQHILDGGCIRDTDPHGDVWGDIVSLVQPDLMSQVSIGKVTSHCDISKANSDMESWAFWHNCLVDRAAMVANFSRPGSFWDVWQRVCEEQQFAGVLLRDTWSVILKNCRMDTKRVEHFDLSGWRYFQQDNAEDNTPANGNRQPKADDESDIPEVFLMDRFSQPFVRKSHLSNLRPMLQWWNAIGHVALQSDATAIWMSGVQLYIDFIGFTGLEGPTMVRGRWVDRANATLQPREVLPVTRRVKMFLTFWKAMLKELKVVIPAKMQRAHSAATTFWGQCYRLKWPKHRCDLVDEELIKVNGRQVAQPQELGYHSFLPLPEGNGLQLSS